MKNKKDYQTKSYRSNRITPRKSNKAVFIAGIGLLAFLATLLYFVCR